MLATCLPIPAPTDPEFATRWTTKKSKMALSFAGTSNSARFLPCLTEASKDTGDPQKGLLVS